MSSMFADYPPSADAQKGAGRRRRSASPKPKAKTVRKGSYESMTVEQLQKKAKKYGVAYSGLRKAQLISAIRAKK